MLLKIRTWFSGQSLILEFTLASINAAALVDLLPGGKWDAQGARGRRCCIDGALHQAGVNMGEPEAETVLDVPFSRVGYRLCLPQEFCNTVSLLDSQF